MNTFRKTLILGFSSIGLLYLDGAPNSPLAIGFIAKAEAIVGRPATPVSYAGVARRSAGPVGVYHPAAVVYHPVAVTTAVVATTAAVTTAAVASSEAAAAKNQQALMVGTAVAALPGGCESATINGVNYDKCGGVYYRPAYQGNTLVYIVSAP